MNHTRTKAVGVGLALLAGELRAVAADTDPPAQLPAQVRTGPWTAPAAPDTNLIWLPPRKPGLLPPPTVAADPPAMRAIPPTPADAGGPRPASGAADALGPLPSIPLIPEPAAEPRTLPAIPAPAAAPLPAVPTVPDVPPVPIPVPVAEVAAPLVPAPGTPAATPTDWQPVLPQQTPAPEWTVALDPQAPAPPPRPVDPLRPMTPTTPVQPPAPTQPLPTPRPVEGYRPPGTLAPPAGEIGGGPNVQPHGELPAAPPELMRKSQMVAPGKHGTFGSPPIRLSKDYPALADLCGGWLTESDMGPDEGPAADRFYVQAELLLWWVNRGQIPVLATTTTAPGSGFGPNGQLGLGFLGDPTTRVLLGPGPIGDAFRQGFRTRAGMWFDDGGSCGLDGSFFFLGRSSGTTAFDSNQFQVITRPYFSPNTVPGTGAPVGLNGETGETVANTFVGPTGAFSTGVLTVDHYSSLWGADANVRKALCRQCDFRAEVFAGYRYLGLSEGLAVTEYIVAQSGNQFRPAGTRAVVQDRFDTNNQFHGGQLGAMAERQWGRLSLSARGSVALGVSQQALDISGGQLVAVPGQPPVPATGGLLAVGPNLGHFTRSRFAVVPEVTLNVGYWLTSHLKAYAGYNFLYWSSVIRPGEQIDRVIDQTFIPNPGGVPVPFTGQNRPQPLFQQTGFWAQGVQFGLEARW